eukprot:gene4006-7262_t
MESLETIVEKLKVDESSIHRTTIQKFKLINSLSVEQTKLLYELLTENSTSKSYEAINVLTDLTLAKKIKPEETLEIFINKATTISLSTLTHLVESIIKVIQIDNQKGSILVSISDSRKEINQILVHLTPNLLLQKKENFQLLSSFFGKIFAGQNFGLTFQMIRGIINSAIYHSNQNFSKQILEYLMKFLTVFPIDSNDIFSSCFWPNQSILDLIVHLYCKEEEIPKFVVMMMKHLFSLYKEVKMMKKETNPILDMLKIIFNIWDELLIEFLPFICSLLLDAETSFEWSILNEFIFKAIEIIHENEELGSEKMKVNSTILPLLHVLSTGPQNISKFAVISLNRIEKILKRNFIKYPSESEENDEFNISDVIFARNEIILNEKFDKFCSFFSENLEVYLNSSLQILKTQKEHKFQNLNYYCILVSLVFFETRNKLKERKLCLEMIEKLSNQFPLKIGMFFLPLLLYELSRENNSKIKLEIMNYIPLVGTSNFICVTTANKILNSFMQNQSLIPITIQLFAKLWIKNDRFFSKLKSILGNLIEKSGGYSSMELETRMSLAQVLKKVCEKSPNKGLELLSPLSTILTTETHPTILVLGMQAMGFLCKADLLDFYLAWFRLVSKHILVQAKKSSLVLSEMCKLFEYGVEYFVSSTELDFDYESENMEELKILISVLLDQINHKEELVRISAYETLSKYSLNALIFSISEEEQQETGEEAEEEEIEIDIFTQMEIYKELVMEFTDILMPSILQEKSPKVLTAAKDLISKIMNFELQKPLGTYVSKEKSYIKELDLLHNLPRFIVFEYKNSSIQQTISSSVLWGYKGDSNSNYSSKSYLSMFKDMISDVSVESDVYAHLMVFNGFIRFISNYFHCLVEEKSQGEKTKSVNHFNTAFNIIFTEIKTLLKTLTIPSMIENAIISLGALCLVLPPASYQNVQYIIKYLNDFYVKANEEWILFACNFALVCASFELRNHSQVDLIIDKLLKQLLETKMDPYSTAISVGMISSQLCQSQTLANIEDVEKKSLLKIYQELMNFSFKTKKIDSNQRISSVIALSLTSNALIRSLDFEKVTTMYSKIYQEMVELKENLTKNLKYETYSFQSSCFVSLPNVIIGLYKVNKFDEKEMESLLKFYWDIIVMCENKSLSSFTNLYKNVCLGLGTLIYSILKSGYSMTPLRISEYLSHFTKVAQQNSSSNIRIGALMFILSVNGVNVFEPFVDLSDPDEVKNLYEAFGSDKRILPMILDVIQIIKIIFEDPSTDSKVKRYSSILLGILSDRYQINSNINGDKSRVPLDTLNEEGFSFNFAKMITDSTESEKKEMLLFVLNCFLSVEYLPNIQWAQRLNQLMKNCSQKEIKQSIVYLLSKEAETAILKSNSLKVISAFYESDQFKSLDLEIKEILIEIFPKVSNLFTIAKSQKVVSEISSLLFDENYQLKVILAFESIVKNNKTPKDLTIFIVEMMNDIIGSFKIWDKKTFNVLNGIAIIFSKTSNIIDVVKGNNFFSSILKILLFHVSNLKPKLLLDSVQKGIVSLHQHEVLIISNLISHVLIESTTFDIDSFIVDSIGLLSHTIINDKNMENVKKMMNFVGMICLSTSTLNFYLNHLNHSLLNNFSIPDQKSNSLELDEIIFGILNILNEESIERNVKIDFLGNLYTFLFSNDSMNITTTKFILPLLINIQSHNLVRDSKSRWIQFFEKTAFQSTFE